MPKKSRKQNNPVSTALRVIKNAYIPGPFRKVHTVAIIWGGSIGGFFGLMFAVSYDAMYWVAVLCTCIGMVIGIGLALGLVPAQKK